jgi:RimJ/RimL family protein N-acetyltransferase
MPLEGDLVILREQRREDIQPMLALRNDMETQAWSKSLPPDATEVMYIKRFEEHEFSFDPTDARFSIVHKESGEWAGFVIYTDLDRRLSASIGIAVAKKFWGTGVALDTQEVLLKFLFAELGVRVVRLWTHSGNPRAVQLAQKSGFRVSCRLRQAIFKDGRLYDNLILDLLREEYFDLHPELTDGLPPIFGITAGSPVGTR